MKLPHALAVLVASSCLVAGCAITGSSHGAGLGSTSGSSGGLSATATTVAARNISDEHGGGSMAGATMHDEMHGNEAAAFSARDPQFAGPTPQVPIPRDGRNGDSTNW